MDSADRADYMRKSYTLKQNQRQRKWWWSLFLWALDIAMVNSYLLDKSYHKMHQLEYMYNYKFREEVFLAWMDSEFYWTRRYSSRKRQRQKLQRVGIED